jgi:4-hydroxy-4-methyl-2-oxoglutarate aldolase
MAPSTAAVADACVFEGVDVRAAPAAIVPLRTPAPRVHGPALPALHRGSVDVFLEAIAQAAGGEVLVVDNDGRLDEGCIGDLVALEAELAGLAGIVVWGCHRDTEQVRAMSIPVWSLGAMPVGPLELRERDGAVRLGDVEVREGDLVVADDDGVVLVGAADGERVLARASGVETVERLQAERARAGEPLREQLQLARYLAARAVDPSLTFRQHLRTIDAEIEA